MANSQWYIGTPNGVVVCVDHFEKQQMAGSFYHAYCSGPLSFVNEVQLIFQLEHFFDEIRFPHPTTNSRTFAEEKSGVEIRCGGQRVMSDDELLSRHGDLGTFIIRVQHRQNSSWQGHVTWMEQNRTIHFRSIWEMIKLIESAVDTVSEPEDAGEEPAWDDKTDTEQQD